jgi:glutaredoxin/glutathione-dependent peroxiredoxin
MTIAVGSKLPSATFRMHGPDGVVDLSVDDIFAGKRVVLFGLPGAFTPTCSHNHLPGYLENAEAIKAMGVDTIACLAVNDHHVMKAWAAHTGARDKILFLPDGNGDFTRAIGLEVDMRASNFGPRCRRFSALVEDGVVRTLNFEKGPGVAEGSGAAVMIEQIKTARADADATA